MLQLFENITGPFFVVVVVVAVVRHLQKFSQNTFSTSIVSHIACISSLNVLGADSSDLWWLFGSGDGVSQVSLAVFARFL